MTAETSPPSLGVSDKEQSINGPRFIIKPPSTLEDDGTPSASLKQDFDRLLRLIEDERHLCADSLLESIEERVNAPPSSTAASPSHNSASSNNHHHHKKFHFFKRKSVTQKPAGPEAEKADVKAKLEIHKALLEKLKKRAHLFRKAKQNLNENADWTLAQTLFGVTTWYRREEDASLSIKMEGVMDGVPLFEQVAVLREVDLHCKWAPFCSSSMTIAHVDKLDTVGWFVVGLPNFGLMRDGCFRAIGCDSIAEDGSILLVGKGIEDIPAGQEPTVALDEAYLSDDPILSTLDVPKPPTRTGSGRITIRTFHAIIEVQSPTMAKLKIVANIDPNLALLPQSLLEFIMKKLCGVLVAKLQSAAKKILKDPVANPHARKMREEELFYKGWLMPKFRGIAEQRNWEMPPVAAFSLTEAQMEQAAKAELKTGKKYFHSASGEKLDRLLSQQDSTMSEPAYVGQKFQQSDDSIVSEISGSSSSTMSSAWKNNPVAQYLRELEEKTQLKKAKKIAAARERAANRLKPKELDILAKSRLNELREARNRRRLNHASDSGIPIPPDNATKSQRKLIDEGVNKKDWANMWTQHGFITRVFVVTAHLFLLFAVLYSDSLGAKFSPLHELFSNKPFLHQIILQNAGTIGLMLVAAGIHFSLCYILLMYAFSELQIGKLAGRQAKTFYSKNIHLVLLVNSGLMVLAGILKSGTMIIIRCVTWYSMKAVHSAIFFVNPRTNGLAIATPETVEMLITTFWSFMGTIYTLTFGALAYLVAQIQSVVFDSNILGRVLKKIIVGCYNLLVGYRNTWNDFLQNVSDHYGGRVEHSISWRQESYEATRYLLTHSAVFLLVMLLLFNLQAKRARGDDNQDEHRDNDSVESTESSKRYRSRMRFPSADYAFDTIEEEEEPEGHPEITKDFKRSQTT